MLSVRRVGRRDLESGQVMISFALLLAALMALLGLVVDMGGLLAQRRLNQNAADAAAYAAGALLVERVADLDVDRGSVYFDVSDSEVYSRVRRLAGLDPDDRTSTSSTGVNQHAGLRDRTKLTVSLEYWDGGGWCYSPAGPRPVRDVPMCGLHGGSNPPAPALDAYYKLRVAVHSATVSFLPPVASSDAGCLRPDGSAGALTCAGATVVISGPCPPCAILYE